MNNIFELLGLTVQCNASDLHLTPKSTPLLRIHGELVPMGGEKLTKEEIERLTSCLLNQTQKEIFRMKKSIDFAYEIDGVARFRINLYLQQGQVTCVARRLSDRILSLAELNLPESLYQFADFHDGLVLVTGPTGSGKSTTLAALIDRINQTRACNIITVEDPIEYVHSHKKSIVNQRELYSDTDSFSEALQYILREDPDVILIGEMRDLDTMRTAIMAAETGHLVFSTLHARDTVSTINRMIGVFPPEEQEYIRMQISTSLKAVLSQKLLPTINGNERVPIVEILVITTAISSLIRSGRIEQIYSAIETGGALNMQTMEQSLLDLYHQGKIDKETVFTLSKNPRLIERRMGYVKLAG